MPSSHPPVPPVSVASGEDKVAVHSGVVEDVLRKGVHGGMGHDEAEHEWLGYVREQAAEGFAELDQGKGVAGTPGKLMARIDAQVARRTQSQAGAQGKP